MHTSETWCRLHRMHAYQHHCTGAFEAATNLPTAGSIESRLKICIHTIVERGYVGTGLKFRMIHRTKVGT